MIDPGESSSAVESQRAVRKGRGAASNRSGRFERHSNAAFDDGWGTIDEEQAPLRTEVQPDASRTVITRNMSPDLGFDRSINVYRGCEHGCVYCYARPTHAFLGLSPGQDFESRIFAKYDAAAQLERELGRPGYECRMMALGTNTDPYQPTERALGITRSVLQVLQRHNHPLGIVTKSALVTRDIDILADMAARHLAVVALSVTTLDRDLARVMEPRASTPSKRLEAIRMLSEAGIPTGVMVAPLIPGLTDHEIESILEAAREAGARQASYIVLRLPLEIKDLFQEWLAVHAPTKAKRVISLLRQMRGGKLYDARFGTRMKGVGPYAELIANRFAAATRHLGLERRDSRLDTSQFRPGGDGGAQLDLF
jgi:DNA repair photolyase